MKEDLAQLPSSRPKLTNPLRPARRYRKGKAPAHAPSSDSDSDAEAPAAVSAPSSDEEKPRVPVKGKMAVALREVEVDDAGMVRVGGREEVGRTEREVESSEEESESEEEAPKPVFKPKMPGAESDEDSSEYETESEDEPAPIYKPVFVSKRHRDTIAEREKELDPEALEEKRLAELEQRKKESNDLVAESILRELAEKEVGEIFPDVDDTDELDPTGEFEAWKLRELMRIKRDKEAFYAREKEREEVEARRAMPEGLRMKDDLERAKKSRDNKPKGQQVFLQKYHHKGAFYTDLEVLKKHDYTAPAASTNRNVESLPAAMQVRNFGKMSQSKYTHLAKEDTSNPDSGWGKKSTFGGPKGDAGGCFTCGGPHLKRDCPQANVGGPSGSNGGAMGGPPGGSRDSGWGARASGSASSVPARDSSDRYAPPRTRDDDGDRRAPPRTRDDDEGYRYAPPRTRDDDDGKDWARGGERQKERYEAVTAEWEVRERERQREREREREGGRGVGGYRDVERGGKRERSRSRSPRREERERPRESEREREEKRRRVD